ncbi:MAG: hypothetical protein ACLSA5_10555 [Agathobacter rectalis]
MDVLKEEGRKLTAKKNSSMENIKRHDGICRRSSRSRRTILCWATPSRAESMKER